MELERCPFCGGAAEMKTVARPFRHGWVGCRKCGVVIQWRYDPAPAIEKWNRRAE